MNKYCVILITVPNEELAVKIANKLLEQKLAACINIIPQMRSLYTWENKICDDTELLMIIKTKPSAFENLKNEVKTLHSYDVPEIIMLPVENGLREYLQWIDNSIVI